MQIKSIQFKYLEYENHGQLSESFRELASFAKKATEMSYAPYSNFYVGAAIRLSNGQIIKAANQENASYPCGICAERAALFSLADLFPNNKIEAIAITASNKANTMISPPSPCGLCRQVMAEFEILNGQNFRLLLCGNNGTVFQFESVKDLLPLSFDPKFLS
ncbi:MAG TPA: cytidine deaminase [Saprospiraceae bacterium]|nr:cytidine deaminase [Saprospiraceae bacterium]